jgi:dihydrodiol dehydrogenase / D-xylose 1-dehydrogenase (NADP)
MAHPPRNPGPAAGPTIFGIVGAGEITRMVAPVLAGPGGVRVAAIASRNKAAARELSATLGGAEVHDDIQGLLRRPDIDAVYIATPPHLHRPMIIESIKAGKHLICEKPFVMNLGELEDVTNALRARPELRISSCSSRFNVCPPVREARQFIGRGRLGKILRVRLANAMPPPIPLAALPGWKRARSTGGGGIAMDWGVYDLDWLQFLLGDLFEPAEVLGQTDCWGHEAAGLETSFSAEIRCRSGLTIGWERRSELGPPFQRAELRGSEGGLDLPFMPGGTPAALIHYWHGEDGSLRSEIISDPVGDWGPILAYPILELADAIANGRGAASPPSVSRRIHSVIEALYESAASGRSSSVTS